jgi:SPX domain protein involved in polyphosphate accumulation
MQTAEINKKTEKEATLKGPKTNGEFMRIEDKYLVPNRFLDVLNNVLNRHMKSGFPDKSTQFAMIESLYFDSRNLDFFLHDVANLETRYKLRVRRYAPDGVWADGLHLELKRKRGDESRKVRFQVGPEDMAVLNKGGAIPYSAHLAELNPDIDPETLKSRVQKIDELILKYNLVPVRSVTYKRMAYELGDFRVTMDTGLTQAEYSDLDDEFCRGLKLQDFWKNADKLIKKFSVEDSFVLEIKHSGEVPVWMQDVLNGLSLNKTGISKYTYFTARSISQH